MYETADQKEPVYDAKGIETVRRDSCSAVSKVRLLRLWAIITSNVSCTNNTKDIDFMFFCTGRFS